MRLLLREFCIWHSVSILIGEGEPMRISELELILARERLEQGDIRIRLTVGVGHDAGTLIADDISTRAYTHKELFTGEVLYTEMCLFFDIP